MTTPQDSVAAVPAGLSPVKLKPSSRASKKRTAPEPAPAQEPAVPVSPPAQEPAAPDAPSAAEPVVEAETKKTKKASYKSASIPEMSVGDVRKCLNEIRRLGSAAKSSDVLVTNGWSAGDFALKYLLGNNPSGKNAKEDS
eukprot:jgi/Mesvir1/14630/Mv05300-RA.1